MKSRSDERWCSPWLLGFYHRVQDRDQAAHAGGEGDFGWLACGAESAIATPEDWIEACPGHGGHIQHGADVAAATPAAPFAAERPGIARERSDADQGSNFTARSSAAT